MSDEQEVAVEVAPEVAPAVSEPVAPEASEVKE